MNETTTKYSNKDYISTITIKHIKKRNNIKQNFGKNQKKLNMK